MRRDPGVGTVDDRPQRSGVQHGSDDAVGLTALAQSGRHCGSPGHPPTGTHELHRHGALLLGEAQCRQISLLPGDDIQSRGTPLEPPRTARAEAAVPVVDESSYCSHGSSSRVRFSSKKPGVMASACVASKMRTASSPVGTRETTGP